MTRKLVNFFRCFTLTVNSNEIHFKVLQFAKFKIRETN